MAASNPPSSNPPSRPSILVRMPQELLEEVAEHITADGESFADLSSTCRNLRQRLLFPLFQRLYFDLDDAEELRVRASRIPQNPVTRLQVVARDIIVVRTMPCRLGYDSSHDTTRSWSFASIILSALAPNCLHYFKYSSALIVGAQFDQHMGSMELRSLLRQQQNLCTLDLGPVSHAAMQELSLIAQDNTGFFDTLKASIKTFAVNLCCGEQFIPFEKFIDSISATRIVLRTFSDTGCESFAELGNSDDPEDFMTERAADIILRSPTSNLALLTRLHLVGIDLFALSGFQNDLTYSLSCLKKLQLIDCKNISVVLDHLVSPPYTTQHRDYYGPRTPTAPGLIDLSIHLYMIEAPQSAGWRQTNRTLTALNQILNNINGLRKFHIKLCTPTFMLSNVHLDLEKLKDRHAKSLEFLTLGLNHDNWPANKDEQELAAWFRAFNRLRVFSSFPPRHMYNDYVKDWRNFLRAMAEMPCLETLQFLCPPAPATGNSQSQSAYTAHLERYATTIFRNMKQMQPILAGGDSLRTVIFGAHLLALLCDPQSLVSHHRANIMRGGYTSGMDPAYYALPPFFGRPVAFARKLNEKPAKVTALEIGQEQVLARGVPSDFWFPMCPESEIEYATVVPEDLGYTVYSPATLGRRLWNLW